MYHNCHISGERGREKKKEEEKEKKMEEEEKEGRGGKGRRYCNPVNTGASWRFVLFYLKSFSIH